LPVTLQKVLPIMAGDKLAAVVFAVELGSAAPVHDVGPELASCRRAPGKAPA
jgi:hypothetical protein